MKDAQGKVYEWEETDKKWVSVDRGGDPLDWVTIARSNRLYKINAKTYKLFQQLPNKTIKRQFFDYGKQELLFKLEQ